MVAPGTDCNFYEMVLGCIYGRCHLDAVVIVILFQAAPAAFAIERIEIFILKPVVNFL